MGHNRTLNTRWTIKVDSFLTLSLPFFLSTAIYLNTPTHCLAQLRRISSMRYVSPRKLAIIIVTIVRDVALLVETVIITL
jgi:hypothetical protein